MIPDGAVDANVLALSGDRDRVLITGDVRTMSGHFEEFVTELDSPGVILVPSSRPIGVDRGSAARLVELVARPGSQSDSLAPGRPELRQLSLAA